ncbi:hypothetical protein B9Q04_12605, partial [Candidatus Marsarchaeota G2 archaeon BE_D]
HGLEVSRQAFKTLPSFSYTYLVIYGFSAVSPFIALFSLGLGGVFSLVGFVLLVLEGELYYPVVTRFLRIFSPLVSYNIIGVRGTGVGGGRPPVVVMAHYDSTKAALSFEPRMVGGLRATVVLNFVSSCIIPLLLLLSFVFRVAFYASFLFAVPLWVSVGILVHRELVHGYVPGANDNASGVAVLLGLLNELRGRCVGNPLYFVATGSEESGMIGAYEFYGECGGGLDDAYIINVDNPGIGDLKLVTREGMVFSYGCERGFRELSVKVASSLGVREHEYRLLPTDATPAMRRGWRAVSIMAFRDKRIGNYHWYTDTPEGVSPENLELAKKLVVSLLDEVCSQGGSLKEG